MSSQSIQAHFTYNLANSRVREWPFPHAYYENVFPEDFYARLVGLKPDSAMYDPIDSVRPVTQSDGNPAFPDRSVIMLSGETPNLNPDWKTLENVLHSDETRTTLLDKFIDTVRPRLYDNSPLDVTVQLIRDKQNYDLGPHTDNPRRYVVLIIYLPETDAKPFLGTSLYVPNDPAVTCDGTIHHDQDKANFTCAFTAPYRPNCALAFPKTNNSFHGVEPVMEGEERNLIQCFVKKTG